MTSSKTHKSALVLIPPETIWEPIQAIRRKHDRQIRRWMPHITLIYPFRPREEFAKSIPEIAPVCEGIEPFTVELAEVNYFHHGRNHFTLWLAPEPKETLVQLQEAIWHLVPDCNEVRRFTNGFTPHLSVGQVKGRNQLQALREKLQAEWQPLKFVADRVSLIWRADPPDDVFRVDRDIYLGKAPRNPLRGRSHSV